MSAAAPLSLADYARTRENVVIFWSGVGAPAGGHVVAGHPALDFAERNGLLDLIGTVDEAGDWRWDHSGRPSDDDGGPIYKVRAFVSAGRWQAIVTGRGDGA